MKAKPFLSVILPTYNRKYCIARMIDSVLMQSFKDFELIIIDDGSTDGTKEMLEGKYDDKRIRIIYKENGGVSSARNLGISLACGKYITFVDSDDYLLDGFFEDIYDILQRYHCETLVYGGYNLKHHHQNEVPLFWLDREYGNYEITLSAHKDFVKNFCLLGGNSWGCAKIFKTSLIQGNQILFDSSISYGEDLLFNIHVYFISLKIATSPKKFYVCDNNTESLSRGMLTIKEKIKNLLSVYKKLEQYEEYRSFFALGILRSLRKWLLIGYLSLGEKEKQQIKTMYSEVSIEHCSGFENLDFKVAKRSVLCASIFSSILFIAYRVYSRLYFVHPITSPILKKLKKLICFK